MASELSESVWNKWTVTGDLRELIDAELREVREVFALLKSSKHGCYCEDGLDSPPHSVQCARARTLWTKLEIKQ